jgi:acyl-CoA synthetase (AMP-forming)/AMP-acid ligase II
MVSHRNVIANIIQLTAFESFYRRQHGIDSQVLLGLLPFSHAYGLVIMAHVAPYRGDEVIVLPNFQLNTFSHGHPAVQNPATEYCPPHSSSDVIQPREVQKV